MRKITDLQLKLFSTPISEIQLDMNSRDEIPKLLFGLQYIYSNRKLRTEVEEILRDVFPKHIKKDAGRPGMDAWKILVLGTLRLNCNWDYDKVHEISNQHNTVRQMLGHEEGEFSKTYGLQTIRDNVALLTPEILDRINTVVVKYGHSLVDRKTIELHGSCDSFVAETDVHFPTDINLLFDAVRKVILIIAHVCNSLGITEWRQHAFNLRNIKKLFNRARKLKRSSSKDEKKKKDRDEVIRQAYETYLEVVEFFIGKAKCTIKLIRELNFDIGVEAQLMNAENYIYHAERQIDQVRRRVLKGEKIPHDEKVFSIFEEHTEWICKGKAGVRQQLGMGVCILKDQFGFILHHHVMEKVTDDKIAVLMVEETKRKFENLKSCSFDRGFYSPQNKRLLKDLLEMVFLPKKGKLSGKDKEEEHAEQFIKARQKHSAVESSISALQNHSLNRCPDHGLHGFKRYVALAVLARNIQIMGNIIQQKEKNRRQREEKRLAA